jgi:hypothetical protein
MNMKDERTTLIAARIKKKHKKALIELWQAFLIALSLAIFFGAFWLVERFIKD